MGPFVVCGIPIRQERYAAFHRHYPEQRRNFHEVRARLKGTFAAPVTFSP
jgi:hypothetical protein